MFSSAKHRLIAVSLLSTTFLTGCVVWKSDYEKLQGQNEQLQQEVSANQQQISRLQERSRTRSTVTCFLRQEAGR